MLGDGPVDDRTTRDSVDLQVLSELAADLSSDGAPTTLAARAVIDWMARRIQSGDRPGPDVDDLHHALAEIAYAAAQEKPAPIDIYHDTFDKPLLRMAFYVEPGDGSVGINEWSCWMLADDQAGTACEGLMPADLDARFAALAAPPIDDPVNRALCARVPGGAQVKDWLPMNDDSSPHPTARTVMRVALAAAGVTPPAAPDAPQGRVAPALGPR
jgi:hypothetical protein